MVRRHAVQSACLRHAVQSACLYSASLQIDIQYCCLRACRQSSVQFVPTLQNSTLDFLTTTVTPGQTKAEFNCIQSTTNNSYRPFKIQYYPTGISKNETVFIPYCIRVIRYCYLYRKNGQASYHIFNSNDAAYCLLRGTTEHSSRVKRK